METDLSDNSIIDALWIGRSTTQDRANELLLTAFSAYATDRSQFKLVSKVFEMLADDKEAKQICSYILEMFMEELKHEQ